MGDLDIKTMLEIGAAVANVVTLYMNLKIRADISELKVWVLANFERRTDAHLAMA